VTLRVTDETGFSGETTQNVPIGPGTSGPFRLEVFVTGTGSGSVESMPGGIACPGTCETTFAAGTQVALRPIPAPGSRFVGWTGVDIDLGVEGSVVLVDGDRAVSATFASP
jgi:hypothetical protein